MKMSIKTILIYLGALVIGAAIGLSMVRGEERRSARICNEIIDRRFPPSTAYYLPSTPERP
jgi:hypothetical protein